MGVETWLYNLIGRPALNIQGEVLSNPTERQDIDWIELVKDVRPNSQQGMAQDEALFLNSVEVRISGGCDLDPIAHYLRMRFRNVSSSTSRPRGGIFFRQDFSSMMMNKHKAFGLDELRGIGFEESDLSDALLSALHGSTMLITNFSADSGGNIIKHRATGVEASIIIESLKGNLTSVSDEDLGDYLQKYGHRCDATLLRGVVAEIRENWEYVGVGIPEERTLENVGGIIKLLPKAACLVTVIAATKIFRQGVWVEQFFAGKLRKVLADLSARESRFFPVYIDDYINTPDDITNEWGTHYSRKVYFKAAERIAEIGAEFFGTSVPNLGGNGGSRLQHREF